MIAKKLTDGHVRALTKADENETVLQKINSYDYACALITKRLGEVRQKGRELYEAIFWLGGAISKAHGMSRWGERFFDQLHRDTGHSIPALRRALKVWDVFEGDIVKLYHWHTSVLEESGKVLIRDMEEMLRANDDVIAGRQHLRKVEGWIERDGVPESIVAKSGLRLAMAKRKANLNAIIPGTKNKEKQLPLFTPIKTLKKAKEELVYEPEREISIAKVELTDGPYILTVTLKPE